MPTDELNEEMARKNAIYWSAVWNLLQQKRHRQEEGASYIRKTELRQEKLSQEWLAKKAVDKLEGEKR